MSQATTDPYSVPLDKVDVSDSELFETHMHWGYFERLHAEGPVHYCAESQLTTGILATLFDFPWEERCKLTLWSDMATTIPGDIGR